ncbi:MAG: OsmC family protein [Pseudomonadota bacterium]
MTTEMTTIEARNGVDLQALLEARQALTDAPEAAQFTWRVESAWLEGTHCRTSMSGFFGLGEEQARKRTHIVDADHPEQFSASDAGATPVEIVLSGLATCLTAGVATVAENRGITLRKVTAIIEGDMDLTGIMGIDPDVRNGFSDIRVRFDIDADATPAEIAGLVAQSQKRSAVFDIITNPSAVRVTVATPGSNGSLKDAHRE